MRVCIVFNTKFYTIVLFKSCANVVSAYFTYVIIGTSAVERFCYCYV